METTKYSNIRLLITGADEVLASKLGKCLDGFVVSVERTESPRECLTRLSQDDIDVVILVEGTDPDDPGQAIGRIRSTAPRTCVVYISRLSDEDSALKIIRLGAADVLFFDDLSPQSVLRTIGRVAERAVASVQMVSQISDFVLTHSFDGIVALDLQNRILLWNHAMERMFGRKRQEVLGKVATEELPFEGLEREISLAVVGRSFAGEKKSLITRGERRFYQPYYSPLRNRSGSIIGVMANFRDLTDNLEKDRMLVDMAERINQLANTAPQMVWMSGVDGTRNFFNRKWIEFTGINYDALLYDGWLVNIHPQDRQKFQAVHERALQDRSSFHVEYRMRRFDKRYRRFLDSGTPVIGSDGAFLGFIGGCTDTSESGTTQHRIGASVVAKLAASGGYPVVGDSPATFPTIESGGYATIAPVASGQEQSTTMENAPIGVWKLDRDFVITKASRAVADQLGMEIEELIGKPFYEVVGTLPADVLIGVLERDENVQLSGQKVVFGTELARTEKFWDLAAWPLKDKKNQVIGVCVSTMEVDERSNVDKQREDFIATLVHDLKTPLIGADRTLELIINGTLGDVDESQSEVLQMVRRSNQGLLRMVQNLIEVYRYDFSDPDLAFEHVSLFDLSSECARELMAVAEQKHIAFELNLPLGHGGVQIDALAIRRVVLNLIDNAIKFTASRGVVRVWGEETPNQVMVHVKDTGIGIADNELNKVFEKFWRSERGKGQAVGTGLGLYLCKQIVDAHQGDIAVASDEGRGTTFTIMLPRR
ncbi:MAG: PAS domain-containing protein [Candidatus Obscuribacterales bacterium]|nr:PAS domain-containing protein [Candidatus Obscuribacterales bacterium]